MGRSQVCLTGGCARSEKVKPQSGAPGVAFAPADPENGDVHAGHSAAAERGPSHAHAICQLEPSGRQRRLRRTGGRASDAKERTACLTAGEVAGALPHALGVRSLWPRGHLERASHSAPAHEVPLHPDRVALGTPTGDPRATARTYQLLGVRRRPSTPAPAPPRGPQLGVLAAPPRAPLDRWNTETLNTEDAQRRARGTTQGPAPRPRVPASAPLTCACALPAAPSRISQLRQRGRGLERCANIPTAPLEPGLAHALARGAVTTAELEKA